MTVTKNKTPKTEEVCMTDLVVYAGIGVLLSGGAILGCSTVWNLLRLHYFFYTTDLGVEIGSTAAFIAAAMLTLPIAWTANMVCSYPKSSVVLGVLVFLVCAGLLVLTAGASALLGLSQALRSPRLLNASMHAALDLVPVNPSVKKAFNNMQLGLRCCGVEAPSDWLKSNLVLPSSCCNRLNNVEGERCVTPIFTSGCLVPALHELRYFVNGLTFLATTNIIVLAIAVAVVGAHSMRRQTAKRDRMAAKASLIIFSASYSVVDHLMGAVRRPSPGQPFYVLSNTALDKLTY